MFMRLCTPTSPCLAAAAAVLLPLSAPAVAAPAHATAPPPGCTVPDSRDFPLTTRIHGGPDSYEAGGGHGSWQIELRNTTARTCTGIHPVVVLVDERHTLTPGRASLEFSDGARTHTVRLEATDEDELVGAFADADGFTGFTVGPRRTLDVRVRLAFRADAAPDDVTVNAALVQRHEDDGDWVGQSNDYRFAVRAPAEADGDTDPGTGSGRDPGSNPGDADPSASSREPRLPDELARTGLPVPHPGLVAAIAGLLLAGAGLAFARRTRRRR
ncbi:hypothetical protein [Streptomyces sp. MUM 2J]|uniref:hypothetical protein n=1 Tax=Streptomyces sp. MUM 2J TaxID=2791987 RepID=UPI001F04FEA1|nr:hypothetical protein [Streptomyces sp. MUM 2J]MCH0563768.1 hypothetical protein [Streptomyces sp. MUM 2J]